MRVIEREGERIWPSLATVKETDRQTDVRRRRDGLGKTRPGC